MSSFFGFSFWDWCDIAATILVVTGVMQRPDKTDSEYMFVKSKEMIDSKKMGDISTRMSKLQDEKFPLHSKEMAEAQTECDNLRQEYSKLNQEDFALLQQEVDLMSERMIKERGPYFINTRTPSNEPTFLGLPRTAWFGTNILVGMHEMVNLPPLQ